MKHVRKDPDGVVHYALCEKDKVMFTAEGVLVIANEEHPPVVCGVDSETGELFERELAT